MKAPLPLALLAAAALSSTAAQAGTINFDDLAVGTVLSSQYAGVTFAPNAFSGTGGPNGDWATNTDMTIVSATGGDVGGLGTPPLVSGNLLRSYDGWLGEDGDASFSITFASAIGTFSATFAGVFTAASTRIFAYDGATLLGTATASSTGQVVLSFSAPSITKIIVTPGEFNDWVGVDNITYTPAAVVPEASTWAMMALGIGLVALKRRRRD